MSKFLRISSKWKKVIEWVHSILKPPHTSYGLVYMAIGPNYFSPMGMELLNMRCPFFCCTAPRVIVVLIIVTFWLDNSYLNWVPLVHWPPSSAYVYHTAAAWLMSDNGRGIIRWPTYLVKIIVINNNYLRNWLIT